MADFDEDKIRPSELHDADDNEDDGAVDFRFLASLNPKTSSLPKRGLKDFEPHPTQLQADVLTASRQAMYDALDYTRTHVPKHHFIAYYFPDCRRTIVPKPKGTIFQTTGIGLSTGEVELRPEEALWSLERGTLDVHYADAGSDVNASSMQSDDTIPMSLQGAYAAYLGDGIDANGGLTMDKYVVYAGLRRAGYIVFRAAGFSNLQTRRTKVSENKGQVPTVDNYGKMQWLWQVLHPLIWQRKSTIFTGPGPLVKPGFYRSYQDIYRALRLIPAHNAFDSLGERSHVHGDEQIVATPFTTTFDIYKPTPGFRKSAPGLPAFRICVVSANDTSLPTLNELSALLDEQEIDAPSTQLQEAHGVGGVYNRLKHGYKNVIIAIVDQGIVSYMRVCDACFPNEKLYEKLQGPPRGSKAGRGRGKGRGRGGRG